MLRLLLFAHGKRHGALIQGLVGFSGHLDVIPDAQEKQATLWLVQSHLSDELINALTEELFAHRADSSAPSLTLF